VAGKGRQFQNFIFSRDRRKKDTRLGSSRVMSMICRGFLNSVRTAARQAYGKVIESPFGVGAVEVTGGLTSGDVESPEGIVSLLF